jgi:hypothetical protein
MTEARTLADELAALVDVLVPGDELFPNASRVGAQGLLATRLRETLGEAAIDTLLRALRNAGGPLAPLDPARRRQVAAELESAEPDLFLLVRNITYLSYYEQPSVHAAIRALGFVYHAVPLPEGYALPPFDPGSETPRHRRGHWVPTDRVKRVDLSRLGFLGDRNG